MFFLSKFRNVYMFVGKFKDSFLNFNNGAISRLYNLIFDVSAIHQPSRFTLKLMYCLQILITAYNFYLFSD